MVFSSLGVAISLVYYSILNTIIFKGEYINYLRVFGSFLILLSGFIILINFIFSAFVNARVSFYEFKISHHVGYLGVLVFFSQEIYSLITYKQKNKDTGWEKILKSLPFGYYRILGISTLIILFTSWYSSWFHPNSPIEIFYYVYMIGLFLGLLALTIGERKLYLALNHEISGSISSESESAILRDDILTLRAYGDITNAFIEVVRPVIGEEVLTSILENQFEDNPILFTNCRIRENLTIDIDSISGNINRIKQDHRIQTILSSFSKLNSEILKTYSSLTSKNLARKNFEEIFNRIRDQYGNASVFLEILRTLPEGVLEEEKLTVASKDELEDKVKERTKELSKALERAEEASEEKAAIIEAMVDPLLVLNSEGKITSINLAFENVFGYNKENLIGEKIDENEWTSSFDEKLKNNFMGFIKNSLKGEIKKPNEITLPTNDNKNIPITLTAGIMDKEKDKSVVLVFRDVSERKKAEEWKDFLHSLLRHDVGNKIQIVQGYLELLKDMNVDEEQKEMMEKALQSIQSCSELINRVRILKEVESQQLEGQINMSFILKEAINLHEKQAEDKGIDIRYIEDGTDVKVRSGSRGGALIESVFSNLIDNSIKHSNGDLIRISAEENREYVTVNIEDDGDGNPSKIRSRLYNDRHMEEDVMGGGLGLRIVKNVIENLNGKVRVEDSNLGGVSIKVMMKKI